MARPAPLVRRPTIGLILAVIAIPFLSDLLVAEDRALASLAGPSSQAAAFQILSPTNASVVGDGNLVLVEGIAVDRVDGVIDRVEVAIDSAETWLPASQSAEDPTRWSFLWTDPPPGQHRVRARAFGLEDYALIEQSVSVRVENVWTSSFIVDNPYAGAGLFWKGQTHMHTSASFDGYGAMPAPHQALAYKRRAYNFVVITDHDLISRARDVQDETFLVIPGYESTSDSGHIVGAFVGQTTAPSRTPQQRIYDIEEAGGIAILAHPSWRIGWTGTDFRVLQRYVGIEIYNGMTADTPARVQRNLQLWHDALNSKGWTNRMWAYAVDDSHDMAEVDRGWVQVKAAELTDEAIRSSLERGAFYASTGPSIEVLGVLKGEIVARSPEASSIRFVGQDMAVLRESPGSWGAYRPDGTERWIRVEAMMEDGRTAWSQPFWLMPNAPKAELRSTSAGVSLVGQTIPGARVHISDRGEYLGSVLADRQGAFSYTSPGFAEGLHELWLMAVAPWPDQLNSPATLLSYGSHPGPG